MEMVNQNDSLPSTSSPALSSRKCKNAGLVSSTSSPSLPSITRNRSPSPMLVREEKSDTSSSYSRDTSIDKIQEDVQQQQQQEVSEPCLDTSTKHAVAVSKKKKSGPWYNMLTSNYKSRCGEFQRLFQMTSDERLVVDYSCALQRDILIHGRLYVSQNYICFHANIFRWETIVSIRCKDIASITKEKTALVIPNAIQISTDCEKHFFTSFGARDKTYLMIFRVWQNALLAQPMSLQEHWHWVHYSYGNELGLSSDDDDCGTDAKVSTDIAAIEEAVLCDAAPGPGPGGGQQPTSGNANSNHLPAPVITHSDISDTTDSEDDRDPVLHPQCPSPHDGREMVNVVVPLPVDTVFTLMFTNSKFFFDFLLNRGHTDITLGDWEEGNRDGTKKRVSTYTVALKNAVGPKTCNVTETQFLQPCSKPGKLYCVDSNINNEGIPYQDVFMVCIHTCVTQVNPQQTRMIVNAQIKYKKSVWGMMKGFIEKNTWNGMEDYYDDFKRTLDTCSLDNQPGRGKGKRRVARGPLIAASSTPEATTYQMMHQARRKNSADGIFKMSWNAVLVTMALLTLVTLNVWLYVRVGSLEGGIQHSTPTFCPPPYPSALSIMMLKYVQEQHCHHEHCHQQQNPPSNKDEWLAVLQKQDELHRAEIAQWRQIIESVNTLLRQTQTYLETLQKHIQAYEGYRIFGQQTKDPPATDAPPATEAPTTKEE